MGRGLFNVTKRDLAAYEMFSNAGKDFKNWAEEKRLGDEYTAGSGLGAAAPDEYRKYAEQFAETNPEAAKAFTQAAEANYAQPTRQERRRTGLEYQADAMSRTGNTKRAEQIYDQIDQMDLRGLQAEDARLGIDAKKRAAADADRNRKLLEQFQKDVADPFDYLSRQFNQDLIGGQDMAGKKVQYQRTNGGAMAWLTDADGNPILDKNGSPMARHMTFEQARDTALKHYLTQTSPVEQAKIDKEDRRVGLLMDRYDADRESREKEGAANRASHERIAQIQAGARVAGAGGGKGSPQILGFEGDNVVKMGKDGKITVEPLINPDGSKMNPTQIKWFKQAYTGGDKPGKTGLQPVTGNPGMFTDGTNMYQFDGKQLAPVITPKGLSEVKAALAANRETQSQQAEPTAARTAPREYSQQEVDDASNYGPFAGIVNAYDDFVERKRKENEAQARALGVIID